MVHDSVKLQRKNHPACSLLLAACKKVNCNSQFTYLVSLCQILSKNWIYFIHFFLFKLLTGKDMQEIHYNMSNTCSEIKLCVYLYNVYTWRDTFPDSSINTNSLCVWLQRHCYVNDQVISNSLSLISWYKSEYLETPL